MFQTGYAEDRNYISDATGITCTEEEGMTQQQFKEEADINTIVRRFGLTGQLPDNFNMPMSGDFTDVADFQSAMNLVRNAETEFLKVPAETRARFGNDPQKLMAFLENVNNREEAIKLGLVQPPAETPRTAINAIDELRATLTPAQPAPKEGRT